MLDGIPLIRGKNIYIYIAIKPGFQLSSVLETKLPYTIGLTCTQVPII